MRATAENDKKLARAALIVSVLFFIGGLYVFFKDIDYMENNHGLLILLYCLLCGGLYWSFKRWKMALAIPCVVLMMATLTFIAKKYEWRKDYINAPTPFFLEEHITVYPTYEEYLYASMFGGANWVGFSRDCAEPTALGRAAVLECSSFAAVNANYGIDLKAEIDAQFKKMKRTAERLNNGKFKNANQYTSCIRDKSCALIPMLPSGVKADDIANNSNEHMEIRTAFWHLIDERTITAEVCPYMKLCNITAKLGIIDLKNFKW